LLILNAHLHIGKCTPGWEPLVDHRILNIFERDPNLSLVNTSQPMPRKTYQKMIVWMICGSKFRSSLLMSEMYYFLSFS